MSVRTTADEKRDEAKEKIQEAYQLLTQVADPETWGSKDYSEEYIEIVEKSLAELRKIKRKL